MSQTFVAGQNNIKIIESRPREKMTRTNVIRKRMERLGARNLVWIQEGDSNKVEMGFQYKSGYIEVDTAA